MNYIHVELSIIIPCYNVESSIKTVVTNIIKFLKNTDLSYEIILVNDGSTDNTLQILQKLHDELDLLYVSYDINRGKGYAIRNGILKSKGKFVLFTDGDLDISINSILLYMKYLDKFDIAIASKNHPNSKLDRTNSRKTLSNMFNIIVRLLTNIKIKDTQVGFKMGKGDAFRKIFRLMTIDRYAFDVEFLVLASLSNYNIVELPVEMTLKRHFHFKDSLQMLFDVFRISFNYHKQSYVKKLNQI